MIINRAKYPVLNLLKTGEKLMAPKTQAAFPLKLMPQDNRLALQVQSHAYFFDEVFTKIQQEFRKKDSDFKVELVADPVRNVFDVDIKVADQLWNLRDRVPSSSGVMLFNDGQQYFYNILNDEQQKRVYFIIFQFYKDIWTTFSKGWYDYDTFPMTVFNPPSFDTIAAPDNTKPYNTTYPLQLVVTYLLFKEWAELEVKVVQKGKIRRAKLNEQVYINDYEIPITIIDSTWFTRIVRTEGFSVKGHFRLQPVGEGRKDRKLIWIEPFAKEGYTRRAQIER